jgi:hypothetical protein
VSASPALDCSVPRRVPTLTTFALQFPPEQIEPLAVRFGASDETPYLRAGAGARARGFYALDEFLLLCAWKSPRSRRLVAANSVESVEQATGRALAAADEAERMEALLALVGVGVPTASVLLHFAAPGDYPILDVRALESLGAKGRSVYPVSFWLGYLAECRGLAARHGVSLRTLDKALWQHSKERGPMTSEVIAARPGPR